MCCWAFAIIVDEYTRQGGSPSGGGGKCVQLLGGIPFMVGVGCAVTAMEVPGVIGSWCS
jgi:hypothetical protein